MTPGTARRSSSTRTPLVVALVCVVAAAALTLLVTRSSPDPSHREGDKVELLNGKWRGITGAVSAIQTGESPPSYSVRLGGGDIVHATEDELASRALAAGDWVRLDQGGRGRIVGRTVEEDAALSVQRADGTRRRVPSDELSFIAAGSVSPPFSQPSCEPGAAPASSAGAVRTALEAGHDACISTSVGDLDLSGLRPAAAVHVGTVGSGAIGFIDLSDAARITVRARFRSTTISDAQKIVVENSIVGGSEDERVLDQLIFIPSRAPDVTIRNNDIGWTTADDTGNTGYGLRIYGPADRLLVQRNLFHHLGSDAIQGVGDSRDVLIDRNEIAFVAPPADSEEHADDIQITGNGTGLRITNNFLHHNGLLSESGPKEGGSGPYIHGGDDDPLLFANNLVVDEQNFMQVGNLGTGGTRRSNLTFRGNTFARDGLAFENSADLAWRLSGGTGNVFEANVVVGSFWNEFGFGSHTAARDNLEGDYRLDRDGNCVAAACNPAGKAELGFRRPSNVRW